MEITIQKKVILEKTKRGSGRVIPKAIRNIRLIEKSIAKKRVIFFTSFICCFHAKIMGSNWLFLQVTLMERYESRIQITQGVLRAFFHKMRESQNGKINTTDAVYALSIVTKEIIKEKVSSFGVSENYYDPDVEKRLSEEVEGSFGDAYWLFGNPDPEGPLLTEGQYKAIRNYIKFSII